MQGQEVRDRDVIARRQRANADASVKLKGALDEEDEKRRLSNVNRLREIYAIDAKVCLL